MQFIRTAVLGLTAVSGLCAQSWEDRIATQWPGDSLLKVSEREFTFFLEAHLPQLGDKAGAVHAFQAAQARAYGLQRPVGFAIPTRPARLPQTGISMSAAISEGNEPNGDPNNGGGLPTLISVGDEGQGSLTAGDDDWWQFTLTRRTALVINTTRVGNPLVSDTVLELFDSSSNSIAFNDDFGGYSLYSRIDITLDTGVYYAKVRAFGSTQTGHYGLDIHEPLSSDLPTVLEGPEDNGDPNRGGRPTIAGCDVNCLGELSPTGDRDWFAFTLSAATDLVLETGPDNPNGPILSDSVLRLYDAGFNQLAFDDDGGPGLYSRIAGNYPAGTYFAAVGGFADSRSGHYDLDIICRGAPVPASYSISGQGCALGGGSVPALSVGNPELPVIGSTFSVRCSGLDAGLPTLGNLGFSQTLFGGIAAPVDLTPFGAPGCFIYSDSAVFFPLVVEPATSSAMFSVEIPSLPFLMGLNFYEQVFVLDASANAFGAAMSDVLAGTFGQID